jgi:type IV secretion system protein VirD4
MAEVYRLIARQEPNEFKRTLMAMAHSDEDIVRQGACTMLHMEAAREQSASVKTVLIQHLKVWSFGRVQEATSKSDFSFKDLRIRGEDGRPTTFYFSIPFESLPDYRPLVRVMTGVCMRQLRESWSPAEDDNQPPVMMYLDEFPQLHRMEPIEDALLYMRSYAVRFWFFCQSIYDLERHYPETWKGFIANCTKCFFGVQDIDTAKIVSEMTGTATVRNYAYNAGANESVTDTGGSSSGTSSGHGGSTSSYGSFASRSITFGTSVGRTQSYVGRPLLMPDEVLRMPYGSLIAILNNMPPIRGQLRFWHEDPELRRRGMISPPRIGDGK